VSRRIADIIEEARERLSKVMDERERERSIQLLFLELRGYSSSDLVISKEEHLNEVEMDRFEKALERLEAEEPLQYILGYEEFYGMELKTDERALIPRPETEEMIEKIVEEQLFEPERILDLGTGNGCIALALKKAFPEAEVYGVDRSGEALALAQENAERTGWGLHLLEGGLEGGELASSLSFDLIVSNPPYVLSEEREELSEQVRSYEPDIALFAPEGDGLDAYRSILDCFLCRGTEEGQLWVEAHPEKAEKIGDLFRRAGCEKVRIVADLSGKERFVKAHRPPQKRTA
jgi:release factor glutamine methyltransferase